LTTARRSLFYHRDFRNLWAAETISQFGTQVSLLALPLVAALVLKVSPFEFALLGTFEFLPFVLVSLPAGVWVDRLRRRPILIVGDLGRAISLASVPIAYFLGVLTIWQLYLVGFINGVLTVFFDVSYQAYLPSLVDRDQLNEGNAKLESSRSVAQIGGPGLAGVVIGALGPPVSVLLDSISFVGSALFLMLIRKREPQPPRHVDEHGQPRRGMRAELVDGLRYVLGHPFLRNISACTGSANFFGNIVWAVFLFYLAREVGLSAELIGIVFAVGNIGALAGAVLANRIASLLGVGRTILLSALIFGPGYLLIPFAPRDPGLLTVALLIGSVFIGGFGSVVYNVNQVSLRQAITPQRMQGRMNATMRFIVWGTIPAGQIIGGALATTLGLLPTLWIGAIGGVFTFLPILFSKVPTIREMPAPVDEPGIGDDLGKSDEGVVSPTQRHPTPEP
jgi:MFS family permease